MEPETGEGTEAYNLGSVFCSVLSLRDRLGEEIC